MEDVSSKNIDGGRKNNSKTTNVVDAMAKLFPMPSIIASKHIYFRSENGLEARISDLIASVYFYNYYKTLCDCTLIDYPYFFENEGTPPLNEIFPKAVSHFKIMPYPYYHDNFRSILRKYAEVELCYNSLGHLPTFDELDYLNRFCKRFQFTYDMYKTFSASDKKMFQINTDLIDNKLVLSLGKSKSKKFAVVVVNYGRLLSQILGPEQDIDIFLLYTPQFYVDMIKKIQKEDPSIPIYICSTNTFHVANKFVYEPHFTHSKNVFMLDLKVLDCFYLMTKASHIVMTMGILCLNGAYLNENKPECHLAIYRSPETKHVHTMPYEFALLPHWKVYRNKEYILNYNKELAAKMLKYCGSRHGDFCV